MTWRRITTGLYFVGLPLLIPIACNSDDDENPPGNNANEGGAAGETPVVTAGDGPIVDGGAGGGSGGGVVDAACSAENPSGSCDSGSTCIDGTCTADADLCSSANPTGLCAGDEMCYEGECVSCTEAVYTEQPTIGVDTKEIIEVDGLEFKDSSGDGELDPYEDWRLLEICRAKDLVSKMSVEQKVGLMSERSSIGSGTDDGSVSEQVTSVIQDDHTRQALIRLGSRTATELANYLNSIQKLCEAEEWGVPFVVTADPVHGFGMSTSATGTQSINASAVVSPWPYPLGLGAINDLAVTHQYGETVRDEFKAMGFRWQLGPMADLATEPRWARVQNTFGVNAYMVANHSVACVEGFQSDGDLKNGIAATIKHFPGAGADEDGKDSHSRPGKFNVFPGDNFEYHQIPFISVFQAGAAAVMPCYSIFKGQTDYSPEQTGAAFSKGLVTDYMKRELGFNGMVTSDWGTMSSTAWGVESLTQPQRAAMFVKAGSHQLGSDSHTIVQAAYDQGLLTEEEINGAAEKILEMSFKLGIFENPYVDADATSDIVRSEEHLLNGFVAQKKAIVILKNRAHDVAPPSGWGGDPAPSYLPIRGDEESDEYPCDADGSGTVTVYFDGVAEGLSGEDIYSPHLDDYNYASAASGTTLAVAEAATPAEADIAVLRITARKGQYFGLDAGVPLSFDGPFPGTDADGTIGPAIADRNKVIDLLRIRDGYVDSDGNIVDATNPDLKIVLVMHMDRPGIVEPFINGLATLNETPDEPGSYPMVSDPANLDTTALKGVDGFLVEFGAHDRAVLDVIFNQNIPETPSGYVYGASLPMEIPSSDSEVEAQYEDLPADTWSPTFALGAGQTY